jgi:hypothetical protein
MIPRHLPPKRAYGGATELKGISMSATKVIMADTISQSAGNIPTSIEKVAGYVTGTRGIRWTSDDWARFSEEKTGQVHINQSPASGPMVGSVLDIETDAWTIADAVKAVGMRHAAGKGTCLYADADMLPALTDALTAAKVDAATTTLWVAAWSLDEDQAADEVGEDYRGFRVVAVQYASPSSNPKTILPGTDKTLKEANVDLSVALASWFPAKPVPAPQPAPEPAPEPAPAPAPAPEPEPAPAPAPAPQPAVSGVLVTDHGGSLISTVVTSTDGGVTWA